MRTTGETVSLKIGDQVVDIGQSYAVTVTRAGGGRRVLQVFAKPYWPGVMHASALISDRKKEQRKAK